MECAIQAGAGFDNFQICVSLPKGFQKTVVTPDTDAYAMITHLNQAR